MSKILNCYISGEPCRIKVDDILEIAKILDNRGFLKTFIKEIEEETEFLESLKELLEKDLIGSDVPLKDHRKWIAANKKLLQALSSKGI